MKHYAEPSFKYLSFAHADIFVHGTEIFRTLITVKIELPIKLRYHRHI